MDFWEKLDSRGQMKKEKSKKYLSRSKISSVRTLNEIGQDQFLKRDGKQNHMRVVTTCREILRSLYSATSTDADSNSGYQKIPGSIPGRDS